MKTPFVYIDKKSKIARTICISVVLLIYVFLFTSNMFLPSPLSDKDEVTKLGEETEYSEQRYYTLISARYSKSQDVVELVFNFRNGSYDGIDKYHYAVDIERGSGENIKINELFNDPIITVIHISGIKRFDEIKLYFAPMFSEIKDISDDDTAEVILNDFNIEKVENIDLKKSKYDYLKERLESVLEEYKKKLTYAEEQIHADQLKITSLEQENADLEKNKEFVTNEEFNSALKKSEENKQEILKTQGEIEKRLTYIEKLKTQIVDAENKIRNLDAETN